MLAACTHVAPQPPAPERACPAVARACDGAIADGDALAIERRRCVGCHVPGAIPRGEMVDLLSACAMPPPGHALAADERARLVAWASCDQRANSFLYSP